MVVRITMPAQPATVSQNGENAKTLADILVDQGGLSAARAQEVKMAEVQSGRSQEDILTSQNLVDEEDLTKAKAFLYNIPFVDLTMLPSDPEALNTLPLEVAEKFRVYPIAIDKANKQLTLAMADPLDLTAIEFVEQKTNLRVKPEAAVPSAVDEFLSTRYSNTLYQEVTEALKEVAPEE